MKKVLMMTHGFPGHGGRGDLKLIKYLDRFGYEPIVLTNRSPKDPYEDIVIDVEFKGKCKFHKTACLNKTPFRIFSKFFNSYSTAVFFEKLFFIPDIYITWVPSAFLKGLQIIKREKIEAIITASPPESIHITGLLLSKFTGVKLITDLRDLWTTREVAYKPPTPIHNAIVKKIERFIYKKTDHIIANTYGNKEIYKNSFKIPEDKITVITNGYDPEELVDCESGSTLYGRKEMKIGYMGNFDKYGLPCDKFLLAMKKLKTLRNEIEIKLVLYGTMSVNTKKFIKEQNLTEYVDNHGVVPHHEAYKLVQKCDLLLLLLIETGYSKAWVPHKLYHYLSMSKPIFALADEDGEIAHIINSTNTGRVISAKKQDEIINAMMNFYNEWADNGYIRYEPNKKQVEQYNVISLTEQLSRTIDFVTAEKI